MTESVKALAGSLVDAPEYSVPDNEDPVPSGELGKDAFLKLLVAQLKYQDPLEPSSSEDFIATTAQFTVVEKLDELTKQGANTQLVNSLTTASTLIGREVTATQGENTVTAVVNESRIVSGQVILQTEQGPIGLDEIVSVGAPPPPPVQVPTPAVATPSVAGPDENLEVGPLHVDPEENLEVGPLHVDPEENLDAEPLAVAPAPPVNPATLIESATPVNPAPPVDPSLAEAFEQAPPAQTIAPPVEPIRAPTLPVAAPPVTTPTPTSPPVTSSSEQPVSQVETPAAETPVVESPAVEPPAIESPAIQAPALATAGSAEQVADQAAMLEPTAGQPVVSRSDAFDPFDTF